MRSFAWLLGLTLVAVPLVFAQEAPKKADDAGERCLADQPVWQQYVNVLQDTKAKYEQDLARLRAEVARLSARVTELEPKKK